MEVRKRIKNEEKLEKSRIQIKIHRSFLETKANLRNIRES